jgi:hypothetical protein
MKIIRLKDVGSDVVALQQLLCPWGYTVDITGIFDEQTDTAVRRFQKDQRLASDGIVGNNTWKVLQDEDARSRSSLRLTEVDFVRAARMLQVDTAAIHAVQEVETGGRGGFFAVGRPAILFEGHIFWSQLKKNGLNPEEYVSGNEDILYQKWTKEHYKGGMDEYKRLAKALKIHEKAAACSASWGLFQIMGFNYLACGCANAREFVSKMCSCEGDQLDLFVAFLKSNGWDEYLKKLDWTGFARHYNGPSYAQNKYDEKLMNAYKKYK